MIKRMHYKPGSALITVMITTTLFLGMIGIIYSFTSLTQIQSVRETKIRQAVDIGNAAINRGLAKYRAMPNYRGEPYRFPLGGEVDIQVDQATAQNPLVTITTQAYVPDKTSPDRICRGFRVKVDPEAVSSEGTLPSIVGDTYQEIKCQVIPPPPTNAVPQISIVKPGAGGDRANLQKTTYDVIYTLYDVDNAINTSFYYDNNNSGENGTLMKGSCSLTDAGTSATQQKICQWDISDMAPGSYYVYGSADDGVNPKVTVYSAGPVVIPNSPPILAINQPDGVGDSVSQGAIYQVNYDLLDINTAVTARFYYDTDNTGFNGTALAGQCATAAEGLGVTCDWVVPKSLAAGNYYIYGTVTDSVNPQVRVYSAGPLTVTALPPPPPNVFTITRPAAGDTVIWRDPAVVVNNELTIGYNLDDTTGVRLANFYLDTDNNQANGRVSTGTVCTNQAEGSNMSCAASLARFADGTYYVYGEVINKTTLNAFSAGTITIKTKVNVPPSLSIAKPSIAENITSGAIYNIQYNLTDPDTVVTAAFAYDNNKTGFDGTPLTGSCANAPEGSNLLCSWNTTGMAPGTYHIYGTANDGMSSVQVYAPGSIVIQAPNTAPTLSFTQPDGVNDSHTVGATVPIQYSLVDPDNVVTGTFYFDTDNNRSNGFGTNVASCDAVAEGTNATCNWNTTGVAAGSYYIYGVTEDGINPAVNAYSPGKVTLTGVPVNAAPTMTIPNPDGVNDTYKLGAVTSLVINYNLNDSDDVVTAELRWSTDPRGLDLAGMNAQQLTTRRVYCVGKALGEANEGTNQTCTWDITGAVGLGAGKYYMFAQTKGGSGANVHIKSRSLGPFTFDDACAGNGGSNCPPPPECSDGADNDGDGKIDYPNDPGCDDPNDIEPDDIGSEDVPKAIITDSAGNVFAAGYRKKLTSNYNEAVIRKYLPSGAPDTSWGTNGMILYKNALGDATFNDIALDNSNNLYVVGTRTGRDTEKWMLRKYTATGAVATNFGENNSGMISYSRGGASQGLKLIVRNNDIYTLGMTKYNPDPYAPWPSTDPVSVSVPHVRRFSTSGNLCDGSSGCDSWGQAGSYRVMGLYECALPFSTTPTIPCPLPNATQTLATDLYYDGDGSEQGLYIGGYTMTNANGQSKPVAWVMRAKPNGQRDFDFIGVAPTTGGIFFRGQVTTGTATGARGYALNKLAGDIKFVGTQTKNVTSGSTTTRAQEGFTLNFRNNGTNSNVVVGQATQQVGAKLNAANIFHTLGWGQNDSLLAQQYNGSATWGWDSTQPASPGTGKLIDADVIRPLSFSFDSANNMYVLWNKENGCGGCSENLDWMIKKYDSTGHIVTGFGTNGVVIYDSRFDTN